MTPATQRAIERLKEQGCLARPFLRDSQGLSCAIGVLITEDLYEYELEEDDIRRDPGIQEAVVQSNPDLTFHPDTWRELAALQSIHDTSHTLDQFLERSALL